MSGTDLTTLSATLLGLCAPIGISGFFGLEQLPQFTAANHASCYLNALLNGVSAVLLWTGTGPSKLTCRRIATV
jgi:hypothetical protein